MPKVTDEDPIPAPPLPPPGSHFEQAVRQHPFAAVIIAAIIGLLIGKIAL